MRVIQFIDIQNENHHVKQFRDKQRREMQKQVLDEPASLQKLVGYKRSINVDGDGAVCHFEFLVRLLWCGVTTGTEIDLFVSLKQLNVSIRFSGKLNMLLRLMGC